MLKRYWLLTVFIFVLGVAMGVAGHVVWVTNIQPEANSQNKDNATKVDAPKVEIPGYDIPDLSQIVGNDVGIGNASNPNEQKNEEPGKETNPITISAAEQEQIVADYKLAIGTLFDAWKVKDMPTFRTEIATAYTGELMENHIIRAEKFLPRGVGLYVTNIQFDDIDIESADKYSATVNAIYRYTVRDYDLDEEYPFGDEFNHFVHVRANLVKVESRWKITGETVI